MADQTAHAAPDGGAFPDGAALLGQAAGLVARRRCEYGEPAELFEQVARRWSLTFGVPVTPAQVCVCLLDVRLARLARDPAHPDSQLDLAGHVAALHELTSDGG